jgi:hypothetical protein
MLSEAICVPPPPEVVPEALSALKRFLHSERRLPLLIKIGWHTRNSKLFTLDGNGRAGVFLITFPLFFCAKVGCFTNLWLCLSHYFKRHRDAHDGLLQATRSGRLGSISFCVESRS